MKYFRKSELQKNEKRRDREEKEMREWGRREGERERGAKRGRDSSSASSCFRRIQKLFWVSHILAGLQVFELFSTASLMPLAESKIWMGSFKGTQTVALAAKSQHTLPLTDVQIKRHTGSFSCKYLEWAETKDTEHPGTSYSRLSSCQSSCNICC